MRSLWIVGHLKCHYNLLDCCSHQNHSSYISDVARDPKTFWLTAWLAVLPEEIWVYLPFNSLVRNSRELKFLWHFIHQRTIFTFKHLLNSLKSNSCNFLLFILYSTWDFILMVYWCYVSLSSWVFVAGESVNFQILSSYIDRMCH